MKRCAVCMLLLILTGCSENREVNDGLELRSKLLQAAESSFSICVNTDNDGNLYAFSMDCVADQQGNIAFTVIEPETISGITGKISASGGALTFDDTALDFGLLADGELSPVSAPWILMNALRSGCITSACKEGETVRLSIDNSYEENALRLDIWLNSGKLPEHADVLQNGRRVLSLDVKKFVIM